VTCTAANQAQIASVVGDELAARSLRPSRLELAQYHPSTESHGSPPPCWRSVSCARRRGSPISSLRVCPTAGPRSEFRCEIVGKGRSGRRSNR
jgi:hypothetical protein